MVVAFLASDLSKKTAQVPAPEALAGLIALIRLELIVTEQPGIPELDTARRVATKRGSRNPNFQGKRPGPFSSDGRARA